MRVLVTGGAGSIGVSVARALLRRGDAVTIVDNFNDLYDPHLKRARLSSVLRHVGDPVVEEVDITDADALAAVFERARPDTVIHLAAWAHIGLSVPYARLYTRVNVSGSVNVFEECVKHRVKNVVFASTSAVYGRSTPVPFREDAPCDAPAAPYPASKRAGELYARMYHSLYGLSVICLRFFTVYGPWIRPDMAMWKFTEKITREEPITLHVAPGGGDVTRDFTYIDDLLSGILAALDRHEGFDIVNIGGSESVDLRRFVSAIERGVGKKAIIKERPLPPSEALVTAADLTKAREILGFRPTVSIEEGARRFTRWYREEYLLAFPRNRVKVMDVEEAPVVTPVS